MDKETVFAFLDYANINRATRENGYQLDYSNLLNYVSEGRFLIDAYCYVPINPRNEHRLDRVIEDLWRSGYIVSMKVGRIAGGTYKCNFDVEITRDVLRVVHEVKPDIIVFASGDADFVPLIQEVRKLGIRVEVAAFAETAGAEMQLKCSGFIDLAVYYESYLAAQDIQQEEHREARYQKLIESQELDLEEDDLTTPAPRRSRVEAPSQAEVPGRRMRRAPALPTLDEESAHALCEPSLSSLTPPASGPSLSTPAASEEPTAHTEIRTDSAPSPSSDEHDANEPVNQQENTIPTTQEGEEATVALLETLDEQDG